MNWRHYILQDVTSRFYVWIYGVIRGTTVYESTKFIIHMLTLVDIIQTLQRLCFD